MTCVDHERHEHGAFGCPHRHADGRATRRLERWRTVDGCTGECCMECFFDLGLGNSRVWWDLCEIAVLDRDGIPLTGAGRTEADWMVAMARFELQLADIRRQRPFGFPGSGRPPTGPSDRELRCDRDNP